MNVVRSRSTRQIYLPKSAVVVLMLLTLLPFWSVSAQSDPSGTPSASGSVTDLSTLSGSITADGSSTVWPITDEAALLFMDEAEDVDVSVDYSGTGGGFVKFCSGETDIQNASRPISSEEMQECLVDGVNYFVFEVAYDGITVVVHPDNDFVTCLTVEQLNQLWRPDNPAKSWNDLNPAWPDREIELYGPGPLSGTFDYFTGVINGEEGLSTIDYFPSENDLDLVEGVADDQDSLGYFGYAYYLEEAARLKVVGVDSGAGCVLPSDQTITDGTYSPLSRPLFVYVNASSVMRPEVGEFMRFYLSKAADIAANVGYVPSTEEIYSEDLKRLDAALSGEIPPDGPAQP